MTTEASAPAWAFAQGHVQARCAPPTPSICRSAAAAKAPITCQASKYVVSIQPKCGASHATISCMFLDETYILSGVQKTACEHSRTPPQVKVAMYNSSLLYQRNKWARVDQLARIRQPACRPGGTWLMAVAEVTAE